MNNFEELIARLDRMELQLGRIQLQQQEILAARQAEAPIPTQWLKPQAASVEWSLSESTLRKYRYKQWTDGSYGWIKGIHWKARIGYNRAIVEHWFTYRHDHKTHQDYINRWLKATNQLPKNLTS
ncbi:hypothetical protein [Leptothoe spongobia]|uniref:Uncharacterized protein n=1 Tax=Leptothoe spongobia TAU-MAC 1115 TaxID=1967444 RepID=A0A947GNX4_9CYAN|nr:hypothetical protein [Leptothoe spongobia]MBT9316256.1 hypothetical protein [Leptothoe spongobia TAU-MAC 1115]